MRVFVAGATGAIGRPLVPRLLAAGHDVTAMTRSAERAEGLRALGANAVVADALDADAVHRVVTEAQPEVVLNELTDLPTQINPRTYDKDLRGTSVLRRQATPILVAAAQAAGARRIISQSVSFLLEPTGARVVDERVPDWVDSPSEAVQSTLALERATLEADGIEGIVLRYGYFYGPGTAYAPGGSTAQMIAQRRFPIVGPGTGLWSFIHVDDAAAATVLALDRGAPGIYNVTDDEPAAVRVWAPALAALMGAKPPRHVPLWIARRVAGPLAMTLVHGPGQSNAKAKATFGWSPARPTYREGFAEVFG